MPSFDDRHDVLIAGAGPAGAHLALRLARLGWSVALVDKRRFPRPKPCGEFLSPECLPMLEELGLRAELCARGARPIAEMRLHGYGRLARGRYAPVGRATARFDHGYAIRREVLDELGVRAAEAQDGVTLLEEHELIELVRDVHGRVVGAAVRDAAGDVRRVAARFTVGADGARSRVARLLGAARGVPWLQRWAVVARFDVPSDDVAEVHLVPGGYFAATPIDQGAYTANLVVGPEALEGGGRPGLERSFRRLLRFAPTLEARLGAVSPCEPMRACGPLAIASTRATFDGAALVGDACGFVDPLTGEGLFHAMRGAALCARALDQALRAGRADAEALAGYARARRELESRHTLARGLQRALRHPRLAAAALGVLQRRPGIADLVVATTGDYVPLWELLRPCVWARAWRGRLTA